MTSTEPPESGATETSPSTGESSTGGAVTEGHADQRGTTPRRGLPGRLLFAVLAVAVLLAGAFAIVAVRHHDQQNALSSIRASGIPASVPTSLANLMALSPVPVHPAPNFTLVDQSGHTLSLSSFKGRAVVLEFMDTHCTDICPIVSQEFVDAYRDLGKAASRVVFVGINVNQYHAGVADVASFSHEHRLDAIPSWHFFTGSVGALQTVWHDYGVEVEAPNPNADIIHSSFVYFIDPSGHERYLGNPTDDHTASGAAYLPAGPLASWGQGIALVSRSLVGS
jgi:cytochrome oxidase Cu insertion factor (SCO1/SenC/PrrC family)